jgi:hypothetical protein
LKGDLEWAEIMQVRSAQESRADVSMNSNKSPTTCKNFPSLLLGVYLQLNMFRASSLPSLGAQQLQ